MSNYVRWLVPDDPIWLIKYACGCPMRDRIVAPHMLAAASFWPREDWAASSVPKPAGVGMWFGPRSVLLVTARGRVRLLLRRGARRGLGERGFLRDGTRPGPTNHLRSQGRGRPKPQLLQPLGPPKRNTRRKRNAHLGLDLHAQFTGFSSKWTVQQ